MGYSDHLKALLRPLGLYRLEDSINGRELESIGKQLDLVNDVLEELERECSPLTARSYGLTRYTAMMAQRPPEESGESLSALLRLHGGVLTPVLAAEALSAWGLDASITENGENQVTITFQTQPSDRAKAISAIESLFPCHLKLTFL